MKDDEKSYHFFQGFLEFPKIKKKRHDQCQKKKSTNDVHNIQSEDKRDSGWLFV